LIVAAYPIVITDRLRDCRDFYVRRLGLEVVFEASWIVVLGRDAEVPVLAFMHSSHPSEPPTPGAYSGDGMFITLQVDDARREYERLAAEGMRFARELTDEPWGQRRFAAMDPAGMWVDVVEQIDPEPGWWDQHL
jgi:catechol 2,3-dioxygenase-like lactoylglutathione lyase family enzyme